MAAAGDVDYERLGMGYAQCRRTDPRIAAYVHEALGAARTVVNVGAGAGSYEPEDRLVIAIEPSAVMRAQRPATRVPAIHGTAERLPLDDGSVDAAMAMWTVHQWADLRAGLRELRRVSRGPVVILTADPEALDSFWLAHYAPELVEVERSRYPTTSELSEGLGGSVDVYEVPIPFDCVDGFTEAFYGRPERLLDPVVRAAQSAWSFVDPGEQERAVDQLAADLSDGSWDAQHGALRTQPTYVGSLRLVVSRPAR